MKTWLERLRNRYSEPPPNVPAEHQRFYFAASYGYPCGLLWHFLFIFLFWRVGARPLAVLNIGATAIWTLAFGQAARCRRARGARDQRACRALRRFATAPS
jgi:hypothetical protein